MSEQKDLKQNLQNDSQNDLSKDFQEFVTFQVTTRTGATVEMAVMDEFDFEGKHYVVGALIVGDTIQEEGRYIYESIPDGDDFRVEKIKREFDYKRISEAYLEMEE